MDLDLGPRHRNEFGFGLDGFAHDGGFLVTVDRRRLPVRRASVESMTR